MHAPGREPFAVEAEVADHVAGEPGGVGLVVDRERTRIAERLAVAAQDAHTRRVERRDPHRPHHRADECADSLAHLGRCLVGERDREDARRTNTPVDQVRDAMREHPGLARPGARDHEQRAVGVHHGIELVGVQALGERIRADLADRIDVDLARPLDPTGGVDPHVGRMRDRLVGERPIGRLGARRVREQFWLVRHRPPILGTGCHARGANGVRGPSCVEPRNGHGTNDQLCRPSNRGSVVPA